MSAVISWLNRKPDPNELCCYVCDRKAPIGSVGWERDDKDDRCPRHRRHREKTITTLGEMIASKKEPKS